jgi:hypothetical protein
MWTRAFYYAFGTRFLRGHYMMPQCPLLRLQPILGIVGQITTKDKQNIGFLHIVYEYNFIHNPIFVKKMIVAFDLDLLFISHCQP